MFISIFDIWNIFLIFFNEKYSDKIQLNHVWLEYIWLFNKIDLTVFFKYFSLKQKISKIEKKNTKIESTIKSTKKKSIACLLT